MPGVTGDPAISFRPLERDDLGLLAAWLADPVVRRWWPDPAEVAALERRYGPSIDGHDPTEVFVVGVNGEPAGIAQRYRTADDTCWQHAVVTAVPALADVTTAGIDYLLGRADMRNRGVGTRMVRAFTAALFTDMADVQSVVVAVQQDNRASWRALERAGYRRLWAGVLDTDDPSDAGPAFLLIAWR
jgi:aminoglycoside 6'-N-acetyltransferase